MKKILSFLTLITLSACSSSSFYSTAETVCRKWQDQRLVMSTLRSCVICVEQFGSNNPEQVQGCALGMDASQFLTSGN